MLHRRVAIATVLLIATLFGVFCIAQASAGIVPELVLWQPPKVEFPQTTGKPTSPKEMIDSLRLGTVPIVLEKTELVSLQSQFGGQLGQSGSAGDYLEWLCYVEKTAEGVSILWLESSEIDGGTVGGFAWTRVGATQRPDRRCRPLPAGLAITVPHHLRLGMTRTRVSEILGQPTSERRKFAFFEHEHSELIDGEQYTSANTVSVNF